MSIMRQDECPCPGAPFATEHLRSDCPHFGEVPTTTPVPTPADRESAAALLLAAAGSKGVKAAIVDCILKGERDDDHVVKAFMNHRLQAEARMSRMREAGIALALSAGKLNVALDGQEKYRRHREAVVRDMEAFAAALNDGGGNG